MRFENAVTETSLALRFANQTMSERKADIERIHDEDKKRIPAAHENDFRELASCVPKSAGKNLYRVRYKCLKCDKTFQANVAAMAEHAVTHINSDKFLKKKK